MNVAVKAARALGKPDEEFILREFKNAKDSFSARLINRASGSIVLQANGSTASEALSRLEEAVKDDNFATVLDEALEPAEDERDEPATEAEVVEEAIASESQQPKRKPASPRTKTAAKKRS